MSPGSRNEVTQDSDGVRVFCCSSGLPFYLHLSLKNTLEDSAEEIIMNYHTGEKALVVKRVKAFAI